MVSGGAKENRAHIQKQRMNCWRIYCPTFALVRTCTNESKLVLLIFACNYYGELFLLLQLIFSSGGILGSQSVWGCPILLGLDLAAFGVGSRGQPTLTEEGKRNLAKT